MIGKNVTQPGICKLEQAGKFSINHYAGKVFYSTDGFVHKNVDTIPEELSTLMLQCTGLGIIKDMLVAKARFTVLTQELLKTYSTNTLILLANTLLITLTMLVAKARLLCLL